MYIEPSALEKFNKIISKSKEVHGEKYDYSHNNPREVTKTRDHINILCRKCKSFTKPRVSHHIHDGSGCRSCAYASTALLKAWNLEKLLIAGTAIHGDDYDYSQVTQEDIKDRFSNIPVFCKACEKTWKPTIHDHITHKTRCRNCANNCPYTLENFKEKATRVHGELYDYSLIREYDIQGRDSNVSIICRACNDIFRPTINDHIHKGTGCRACGRSKGESKCVQALNNLGLIYQSQILIPLLSRKKFDFSFTFQDRNYLLEYDGQQHFYRINFFHPYEEKFKEGQARDILKTDAALHSGYYLIRIDYTQIDNIESLIRSFLSDNSNSVLHLSNKLMYKYITDVLYPQITI